MRALFKENIVEALIGALVLLVAIWFVTFAYART
ncbi:outer membrane lipid asymmetry maintenance protein MlaD, partial [Streptosporangium nondiastaticum]